MYYSYYCVMVCFELKRFWRSTTKDKENLLSFQNRYLRFKEPSEDTKSFRTNKAAQVETSNRRNQNQHMRKLYGNLPFCNPKYYRMIYAR